MALKKSELCSSLWASCDELRAISELGEYKQIDLLEQEFKGSVHGEADGLPAQFAA